MLSFKQLQEKKTKIKINPKVQDQYEATDKNHGQDCDCKICEAKRDREENGPDVARNEEVEYVEERDARKMNVRTKGSIKKQIAKDAAAEAKRREKKTGEYAEKPKRKPRLKKPSQLTKVTGASKPEPKKEAPKPKAKPAAKKAAPKAKPVAATKKVTPKAAPKKSAPKAKAKPAPKPAPKKAAPKPVAKKAAPKAKPVAKKEAPKKEAPKAKAAPKKKEEPKSLRKRAVDIVKKGVARHKKATGDLKKKYDKQRAKGKVPEKRAKEFAKGFKSGVKDTVSFAKKAKKAVVGESVMTFEAFSRQYKNKKKLGQSSQRKSLGRGASIKDGAKKRSYESPKEHRDTSKKLAPYQTKGTYNAHLTYKEEADLELDELNRYGKETGKATGSLNKRAGTPVKKGGNRDDKALLAVRKMIRRETGRPEGQQKKQRGKKPPKAGEYGARRSPRDIVLSNRAARKRADDAMRDTRGT